MVFGKGGGVVNLILHVDFNSYFATIEQQANPHLRGKPIGVTGGDRHKRTVVCTASVEAKAMGVRTGSSIQEAQRVCPQLILVTGESDKYLECSKRFWAILKDYSPYVEIFSIDESFIELRDTSVEEALRIGEEIKERIHKKIGEWVRCSVGISYNRIMAKLASGLQKPNGMTAILDPEAAMMVLDQVDLDEICGIGYRIKRRLYDMGIRDWVALRRVPLATLRAGFKSYGEILYNMARGIDHSTVTPFYEKEQVKSIGHQHTIDHDTSNPLELKQLFLKLTELIARRTRAKGMVGRTVHMWFRRADFTGEGMQVTISATQDGLVIFQAAWQAFEELWKGEKIRLVSTTISQLQPANTQTISFLEDFVKQKKILKAIDRVNDIFGEFTVQRGILLQSASVVRRANPFLADRRFTL